MERKQLKYTAAPKRYVMVGEEFFQQKYNQMTRGFAELTNNKYNVTIAKLNETISTNKLILEDLDLRLALTHENILRYDREVEELLSQINSIPDGNAPEDLINRMASANNKFHSEEVKFLSIEKKRYNIDKYIRSLNDLGTNPKNLDKLIDKFTTPLIDARLESLILRENAAINSLKILEDVKDSVGDQYIIRKKNLQDDLNSIRKSIVKEREAKMIAVSEAKLSSTTITIEASSSPFNFRKLDLPAEGAISDLTIGTEAGIRRRITSSGLDQFSREAIIKDITSDSIGKETQIYRMIDGASGKKIELAIAVDMAEVRASYGAFKIVPSISNGLISVKDGAIMVINNIKLGVSSIPIAFSRLNPSLFLRTGFQLLIPALTLLSVYTLGAGVLFTLYFQILESDERDDIIFLKDRNGTDRYDLLLEENEFEYFGQPYFERLSSVHSTLYSGLIGYFASINTEQVFIRYKALWVLDKIEGPDAGNSAINQMLLNQAAMIVGDNNIQAKFWIEMITHDYSSFDSHTIVAMQQCFKSQFLNTFYIMTEEKQQEYIRSGKNSQYVLRACHVDEIFYILLRHRSPILDCLVMLILSSNPEFGGKLPLIAGNEAFYLNTINQYGGFVYYWKIINPRHFFEQSDRNEWDYSMTFNSYFRGFIEEQYQSLKQDNYFGPMFERLRNERGVIGEKNDITNSPDDYQLTDPRNPISPERLNDLKAYKFWRNDPSERGEVYGKVRELIKSRRGQANPPAGAFNPNNFNNSNIVRGDRVDPSIIIGGLIFLFVFIGLRKK